MNLALRYQEFVRKVSEALANELAQLVTWINAWAEKEHRLTGGHKFAISDLSFRASAFTGGGTQTWTVDAADVITLRSRRMDTVVTLWVTLDATSVAGAANPQLILTLPPSLAAAHTSYGWGNALDNGVNTDITGVLTGTSLGFFRSDGANWTAAANTTYIRFKMDYEVEE